MQKETQERGELGQDNKRAQHLQSSLNWNWCSNF